MTDNHRSVIGEITHGRYQCREAGELARRHLKNENGTKLHAQFIFDARTRARRLTRQLSGKALKHYYDGE
jgi:hypothetical protein